jgi:hypothetical protein
LREFEEEEFFDGMEEMKAFVAGFKYDERVKVVVFFCAGSLLT